MNSHILQGDALERLRELPDESVDAIITDPPYGYSFMGKDWDKAVPSVEIWQECLRVLKPGAFACVMSAPRSDVQNAMISRLMEAGFRLDFTPIYWTYASGFPKAGNVGKLVDKRLGAEREVVSSYERSGRSGGILGKETTVTRNIDKPSSDAAKALDGSYAGFQPKPAVEVVIVAMKPLSEKTYIDQALKNGKGITWLDDCRVPTDSTYLEAKGNSKPMDSSSDVFVVPNKFTRAEPNQQGRFPANLLVENSVLSYNRCTCINEDTTPTQQSDLKKAVGGTRATTPQENPTLLNDEQRLQQPSKVSGSLQNTKQPSGLQESHSLTSADANHSEVLIETEPTESGCKPSKLETASSVDSAEQQKTSTTTTSSPGQLTPTSDSTQTTGEYCALHATGRLRPGVSKPSDNYSKYFDLDAWARERLPAEQAMTFPFAIFPKASKSEKNKGLEHTNLEAKVVSGESNAGGVMGINTPEYRAGRGVTGDLPAYKNHHPTVKPLKLMSYLITLFSREGDTVLDPFVGSGTTVVAAEHLNRVGIGIEREAEYAEIARARVEAEKATTKQATLL